MGRLVYSMLASLDGYVVDEDGSFDWAAPGEEVHGFVNDLERTVSTYLYGRRMYEIMAIWQAFPGLEDEPAVVQDYADIWQAADKVVYSTTLVSVTTPRTRLERVFDPEQVRSLVREAEGDVSVAGPTLAASALRAGLVDEVHLFMIPVIVGGGTSCWPHGVALALELHGQHRFADGTVHLHYRRRLGADADASP